MNRVEALMMPRSIDWYKRELKPASSISWQVAGFYAMYILGLPCPIILTSQSSVKFRLFWRLWPPSLPSFGGCVTDLHKLKDWVTDTISSKLQITLLWTQRSFTKVQPAYIKELSLKPPKSMMDFQVDRQLGRGSGHGTDKECGGNLGTLSPLNLSQQFDEHACRNPTKLVRGLCDT